MNNVESDNPLVSKILSVAEKTFRNIETRIKTSNKKEITDEELLTLHSVFGPTLLRALNILEKHTTLEIYSTPNSTRKLIEVKGENNRCYRIFPLINYCPCLAFKHQVVVSKTQVTCKHILAARLAIILQKTTVHEVTYSQYHMLLQSMFESES